ncbi:hypothetical protein BC30102_2335 [Bacillus cereus]|nr:hypothetical protein BC30102_2335 [Bacillus cereus]
MVNKITTNRDATNLLKLKRFRLNMNIPPFPVFSLQVNDSIENTIFSIYLEKLLFMPSEYQ